MARHPQHLPDVERGEGSVSDLGRRARVPPRVERVGPSGNDDAIGVVREEMNALRGHLFESVEAVGLPHTQEDAFKGLIRTFTYTAQTGIEARLRRS